MMSSSRAMHVNLRWQATSSQQCVVYVGTTGVGAHVLWVRAEEGDRRPSKPVNGTTAAMVGVEQQQVLIYGVYEQQATPTS